MPLDDIGIGIRARIQGTEEGERLAQTFQKVSRAAKEVGTQRPGFERWKRELEAVDKSIDRWHSKIQRMKMPFGKEDVRDVQKYGRMAKITLRAVDEEQRISFQERMRRLREEEKQAGILERDKIHREMELTQREQERWERERASYRRIIAETGEEEREAVERPSGARRFAAGLGRAARWGAGIAAAGLAIGGGLGLMDILRRGPQLWTEWETERMRWAQRGGGLETAASGIMGLGYQQNRALTLAQVWAEQAGTFQGARGAYGFARGFGLQPEAVQGMAMIQRLSGANVERLLRRIAGSTEATGRSLALLPEQVRTIQEWAGVMTRYTSRISEQGMVGLPAMVAAMGPEYTGERIMNVLTALQQGMAEPRNQGVRAFMLRAMGLGQPGMNYYLAQRRLEAGLAGIPAEDIRQMYEMGAIGPEAYERYKVTGIPGYMNLQDVLQKARGEYGTGGAVPLMALQGAFPIKGWQAEDIWKQFIGGGLTGKEYERFITPAAARAPGRAISLPEQRIVEIERAGRQFGQLIMPFMAEAQKAMAKGVGKIFDGMDEVFSEAGRDKIKEGILEMWKSDELKFYAGSMAVFGGISALASGQIPGGLAGTIGGVGLLAMAALKPEDIQEYLEPLAPDVPAEEQSEIYRSFYHDARRSGATKQRANEYAYKETQKARRRIEYERAGYEDLQRQITQPLTVEIPMMTVLVNTLIDLVGELKITRERREHGAGASPVVPTKR
jgi:hypothetical protein